MLKPCLLLFIFSVIGSEAGSAPFIKPCVWNDKNCILESSKTVLPHLIKGIPELGITPADPIYIKDINTDSGDLKLHFEDLKITGLGKTVFKYVERPDADKTVVFEFEFPIEVTGKYKAGGKLFVLDVEGNGETEIKCDKIQVKVELRLKQTENNGKKYYKISGFDYTFEPAERVFFKFTNLYNGDEKKAQVLLDLVNENWKDLILEIGKPVVTEMVTQLVSNVKKFFLSVSIDEIEVSQ